MCLCELSLYLLACQGAYPLPMTCKYKLQGRPPHRCSATQRPPCSRRCSRARPKCCQCAVGGLHRSSALDTHSVQKVRTPAALISSVSLPLLLREPACGAHSFQQTREHAPRLAPLRKGECLTIAGTGSRCRCCTSPAVRKACCCFLSSLGCVIAERRQPAQ